MISTRSCRLWPVPCLLAASLGMAGCMDSASSVGDPRARADFTAPRENIARREGVSPRSASIALTGIEGAPEDISTRFSLNLKNAANAQDMTIAESFKAKYLVRIYLTASAAEGGTTRIAYVLDLFDKGRRRVQRVSDDFRIKGTSPDPWAMLDDQALQQLADQSAAALAAVLTNMPEAIAGAAIATALPSSASPVRASESSDVNRTISAQPALASNVVAPRVGVATAQ